MNERIVKGIDEERRRKEEMKKNIGMEEQKKRKGRRDWEIDWEEERRKRWEGEQNRREGEE